MIIKNISLIGMPGSGKTEIGQSAALKTGLLFIDTDSVIEQRYGRISELFEKGESFFRELETKIIKEAAQKNRALISTGGGSILKEENISALKQNGKIIYIRRAIDNLVSEIDDENRPLLKGKKHKIIDLYEQRKDLYVKYADYTVYNDGSVQKTVNNLIEIIRKVMK